MVRLQQSYSNSAHYNQYKNGVTLVTSPNQRRAHHALNYLYSMFTDSGTILRHLKNLLYHLSVEQVCLKNCFEKLSKFLIFYADNRRPLNNDLWMAMGMSLYERSKKCHIFLTNSKFTHYIGFWLASIFSQDYSKNPKLTIKVGVTCLQWKNLPVSSAEIIRWNDDILFMIEQLTGLKHTLDKWYKYWLIKMFKMDVYSQILEYQCKLISNIIDDLNPPLINVVQEPIAN